MEQGAGSMEHGAWGMEHARIRQRADKWGIRQWAESSQTAGKEK